MQAIAVLMNEHRVIERVLAALEAGAARLARAEPVRPGFFLDCADFASQFADGCHHRKEEGALFPAMTAHGAPAQGGPIAVMLHEHEDGRVQVRRLREAATRFERGDATAAAGIVSAARAYVALLRDHIVKEDEVLFPMAAAMIPETGQNHVLAQFARVEHDDPQAHARLLALADALEREVAVR